MASESLFAPTLAETPRVVSDTGVFLRASISPNNVSSSLLLRAVAGEIRLYISHALMAEVRDVLTRPNIRLKNARLDDAALETFLLQVEANTILIDPLPQHVRYERDPNDEHILNLAVEAQAAYIVSFDNDLLDLMKPSGGVALEFQRRYPTVTTLTPGELITRLNRLRRYQDSSIVSTDDSERIP
jgi:putative PIN family toxin of toxin-antitoxin system